MLTAAISHVIRSTIGLSQQQLSFLALIRKLHLKTRKPTFRR